MRKYANLVVTMRERIRFHSFNDDSDGHLLVRWPSCLYCGSLGEPTFISSFFQPCFGLVSFTHFILFFLSPWSLSIFLHNFFLTCYFALVFGVYLSSHSFVSSDERGSITTVMTVYGRRCFFVLFSLWHLAPATDATIKVYQALKVKNGGVADCPNCHDLWIREEASSDQCGFSKRLFIYCLLNGLRAIYSVKSLFKFNLSVRVSVDY